MQGNKPTETMRLLLIAIIQQSENESQHDTHYAVKAIYKDIYGEDATF